MPNRSIETTVHKLLEIHREYSPVELLRAQKQLSEERHRAWLSGEISSLDEAVDDVRLARELLESALSFARGLELVPNRVAYHGVGNIAGRELVASTDPLLNELLVHCHRPSESVQGDLFLDGGKTASINALRDALIARDAGRARKDLQRTSALIPGYRHISNCEKLIAALEAPLPETAAHAFEALERMQHVWRPAAREYLGPGQAAKWLEPLWRDVGHALESAPFDPEHPERHASYAFEQARAWRCLQQSVLVAPEFRAQPVLLQRLATAEFKLRDRTRALEYWFALCLLDPEEFSNRVESSQFEDPGVARAWQIAVAEGDADEELTAEWFPAWMLIHEPGLARALVEMDGKSPPARAFNLLRALQRMPPEEQARASGKSISLRRELQQIHAGLQRSYLAYLNRRNDSC
ncbi:MAG: hypothetical protein OXP09_05825 [Gammaproteobacteria bacterium]|nr:hypothetical protein [Gammaproteobacteria bacterium]MDE0365077.1 hypothetical protein [Gammaproteobacteria bacterium]